MSNEPIDVNNIANEISKNLEKYNEEVLKKVDVIRNNVAQKATAALKATSPKRKGKYRKGWKEKEEITVGEGGVSTIHNPTQYRLTHLLENGHSTRNGGWVNGTPHIKQVEQQVIEDFTTQVEEAIKNG